MAVYSKSEVKEFRELLERLRSRLRGDVQQLTDEALTKGDGQVVLMHSECQQSGNSIVGRLIRASV